MITYKEFKKKYPPGSSVASPEGTFKGQCVSLVRQYMLQVDGFKSGPLGDAAQIPYNPTFLKAYEKVKKRQVGDLMFWGNDAGTWTGPAGHTAIYDGGSTMYNQNYNNSLKVSFNTLFTPGFIGYYRKKETMSEQDKKDLALGRTARAYNWEKQVQASKKLAETVVKENQSKVWLEKIKKLATRK